MRPSRFLAVRPLMLLTLCSCTASWNALVRYSDRPVPFDESIEQGVYEAVLTSVGTHQSLVVNDSSRKSYGALAAVTCCRPTHIPGYWADTLRREVIAALSDGSRRRTADTLLIALAAQHLGFHLVSSVVADSLDEHQAKGPRMGRIVPRVWVSRPGFNHDSTIAVIEFSIICGGLCGSGETLFLARRPGFEWRIWNGQLHWIS